MVEPRTLVSLNNKTISHWTFYHPMRPRERICERQQSKTTDACRSHESNKMTNAVCTFCEVNKMKYLQREYANFRHSQSIILFLNKSAFLIESMNQWFTHKDSHLSPPTGVTTNSSTLMHRLTENWKHSDFKSFFWAKQNNTCTSGGLSTKPQLYLECTKLLWEASAKKYKCKCVTFLSFAPVFPLSLAFIIKLWCMTTQLIACEHLHLCI